MFTDIVAQCFIHLFSTVLQDLGERSATSDSNLEGDSVNADVHQIVEGEAEDGLGVEEDDRGLHIPQLVAELFQRIDTNRAMSQSRSNNEGDAHEPMTADGLGTTQDSGGLETTLTWVNH